MGVINFSVYTLPSNQKNFHREICNVHPLSSQHVWEVLPSLSYLVQLFQ